LIRFIKNYKKIRNYTKGKVSGIPRDGLVSYHVNRRVSAAITALLIDKEVAPNQISIFILVLGILTCVPLYLSGNFVAAGLMVWVISILDGVDGEIARVKGIATKIGKFVDSFLDRLFDIAIIFSIALSVSLMTTSIIPWIFAFIAILGLFLDYYTIELYGNRVGKNLMAKARVKIVKKVRFWPTRDVFLFIISIASFISMPEIGILIAGILSSIFSIFRILIVFRRKY